MPRSNDIILAMNKVGIAKRIQFPVKRKIISNNNFNKIILPLLLKVDQWRELLTLMI